jgi:hypothetical protein
MKGSLSTYKVFALILKVMKKVFLLLFLVPLASFLYGQKVYFMYLQSESGLPFYVKMGDKVNSSNTEGYLILPN